MNTEITRKLIPPMLTETQTLTLTLNHLTLGELNAYRQAVYAEQWPPADLTGVKRLAYIEQQRRLAAQASMGLALFLDAQLNQYSLKQAINNRLELHR